MSTLRGLAPPTPDLGNDGDFYICASGGRPVHYRKDAGVWVSATVPVLMSDVSGLSTALNDKADQSFVVAGLATKAPTLAPGTTGQYFRGDLTWQPLNAAAVGAQAVGAAPVSHSHAQSEVTNLVSDLAGKASTAALAGKADAVHNHDASYEAKNVNIQSHVASVANPHGTTKAQVGLGNVPNIDTSTTANITDAANKRFASDAQLTALGAISGVNTGDGAVNALYSGLAASKQDVLVSGVSIKTVNNTSLLGAGNITISGSAGDLAMSQRAPANSQVIPAGNAAFAVRKYTIAAGMNLTIGLNSVMRIL